MMNNIILLIKISILAILLFLASFHARTTHFYQKYLHFVKNTNLCETKDLICNQKAHEHCHYNPITKLSSCLCNTGYSKKGDYQPCQRYQDLLIEEKNAVGSISDRSSKDFISREQFERAVDGAERFSSMDLKVQLTYMKHVWLIRFKESGENLALFWAKTKECDSYTLVVRKKDEREEAASIKAKKSKSTNKTSNYISTIHPFPSQSSAHLKTDYEFITDSKNILYKLHELKSVHVDNWRYNLIIDNKSGAEVEAIWVNWKGEKKAYDGILDVGYSLKSKGRRDELWSPTFRRKKK